jgi:type VI secretion system protein VasD
MNNRPRSAWWGLCVAIGIAAFAATACSSSDPEPTIIVGEMTATETINPNRDGRPSPVLVRIYELTSDSKFNSVSYFDLYDDEGSALGADLQSREEIPMRPGETASIDMALKDSSQFVGAAAAFQDIDNSVWRAVAPVPPNETTRLTITIDNTSLSMTASPFEEE